MDRRHRPKSPAKSSVRSALNEMQAKARLQNALQAYDNQGEQGLNQQLDQLYPPTNLQSVELPGEGPDGINLQATRVTSPLNL